ncbi:MAG: hypothetical protein RMJ17_03905 [Candidatus Aenigmarchaeota archaeon]|nr:hypothetical protein [Candidatus Aenigmarchaeota archaeon]MDW8149705.1 hypothetical protein [Candidatus Aenigmarchaeota archaeon]
MSYIIGVSSGFWGIARQRGSQESLSTLGFYRKAMQAITKGVNFVQIDIDNISEFQEIDLIKKMEDVKKMGIEYGFHAETAAWSGRAEHFLLDSSIEEDYILTHKRIEYVIDKSGMIGAKFIVYHASETPGYLEMGRDLRSTRVVDFFGRPLHEFLENLHSDIKEKLLDWCVRRKEVMERIWRGRFRTSDFNEAVEETIKTIENLLTRGDVRNVPEKIVTEFRKRGEEILNEKRKKDPNAILTDEDIRKIIDGMKPLIKTESEKMVKEEFIEDLLNFSKRSDLSYGTERIPYLVVAKYMELTNDSLFKNIVKASVSYYSKLENKTEEEFLSSKNIKKLSLDDDNFLREYKLWVPAVSAKYIWGHFNKDNGKLKNLVKKNNLFIALETAMGEEEKLRLANPLHIYYLVKELGENFSIALDLEHILGANINPEIVIDLLPEDAGKFIRVIHSGHPSSLQPAHLRIALGSEEQMYLYKIYYRLRKKGMGKENDCYLIFERGEESEFQESIQSLRIIKEFLEKDIEPEKVFKDPKFFGIDVGEFKAVERQIRIIKEHALDPIHGLIVVSEETHGQLGKLALEKGKRPEEWLRERYR